MGIIADEIRPTFDFLLPVPGDCADDGVLLPCQAIEGPFGVTLSLSGVVFGLASGVLLLAGLLPRRQASHVADGLDEGAFDRVKLARGFANGAST